MYYITASRRILQRRSTHEKQSTILLSTQPPRPMSLPPGFCATQMNAHMEGHDPLQHPQQRMHSSATRSSHAPSTSAVHHSRGKQHRSLCPYTCSSESMYNWHREVPMLWRSALSRRRWRTSWEVSGPNAGACICTVLPK